MAVTEMLLGERALHGLQGEIVYNTKTGLLSCNINGAIDREPIGELRERFSKLKARDALLGAVLVKLGADPGASEGSAHLAVGRVLADGEALAKIAEGLGLSGVKHRDLAAQVLAQHAKLKARDNLLGAVLARLGADPGARETEAHNAVGRLLESGKALAEIAKGLGLDDVLHLHAVPAQVLAMNTEITSALAKAQEHIMELEGDIKGHQEADEELEDLLDLGDHSDGVIATIKKMQARISDLEAPPLGWVQKKIAKVGALVGLEGGDLDALYQGVKAALSSSQAEVKALTAALRRVSAVLSIANPADQISPDAIIHKIAGMRTASRAHEENGHILFVALKSIADRAGAIYSAADHADTNARRIISMLDEREADAQERVKALVEENARLRAEVEQERGYKLHAMTAADIAISRSTDLEAEVRILKVKLAESEMERIMAEATSAGMKAALQILERTLREKLRP